MCTDNLPWYKEGLRFSCTGCGKCCTGASGYVWVTKEEIEAIAKELNMPLDLFVRKYIRQKGNRYALIERRNLKNEYDCVFLQENRCQIYKTRPSQCRSYPWWKDNLRSKACWEEASKECEGIHETATLFSYEEISALREP